jgi:hypothetical protein
MEMIIINELLFNKTDREKRRERNWTVSFQVLNNTGTRFGK